MMEQEETSTTQAEPAALEVRPAFRLRPIIGQRPDHEFDEPLGLLSDCHRRIEHFLRVLVAIAEQANGGPLTAAHRSQLDGALAYLATAAPRHTADEEESLFPRLRASREAAARDTLDLLGQLEHDHADADEHHGPSIASFGGGSRTHGSRRAMSTTFVNTSPRFRPSTSSTLWSKIASSSQRPAGCFPPSSFAISARRWPRDDPPPRAHQHKAHDPIEIFRTLFARASQSCSEPDAMALSTVDPDGRPSSR